MPFGNVMVGISGIFTCPRGGYFSAFQSAGGGRGALAGAVAVWAVRSPAARNANRSWILTGLLLWFRVKQRADRAA